jgi:hypothetical protein
MADERRSTALIRRHKPEQKLQALRYRKRADLPRSVPHVRSDTGFLLDTNIYIFAAAGTLAARNWDKLALVLQHHCTVCLGEIAVGLANRDVTAATWPSERELLGGSVQ